MQNSIYLQSFSQFPWGSPKAAQGCPRTPPRPLRAPEGPPPGPAGPLPGCRLDLLWHPLAPIFEAKLPCIRAELRDQNRIQVIMVKPYKTPIEN